MKRHELRADIRASESGEKYLAALIRDRKSMGTLKADPITEVDLWFCDYVALVEDFRRGEPLDKDERSLLARLLLSTPIKAAAAIMQQRQRRAASRRGGLNKRIVREPAEIMRIWKAQLTVERGKKGLADASTGVICGLSSRSVRRIRQEHFGQ